MQLPTVHSLTLVPMPITLAPVQCTSQSSSTTGITHASLSLLLPTHLAAPNMQHLPQLPTALSPTTLNPKQPLSQLTHSLTAHTNPAAPLHMGLPLTELGPHILDELPCSMVVVTTWQYLLPLPC